MGTFKYLKDAVFDCAKRCNADSKCRTYTMHKGDGSDLPGAPGPADDQDALSSAPGSADGANFLAPWAADGSCFLHNHWRDHHGTRYHKNAVGKDIFSAVCRPEDASSAMR